MSKKLKQYKEAINELYELNTGTLQTTLEEKLVTIKNSNITQKQKDTLMSPIKYKLKNIKNSSFKINLEKKVLSLDKQIKKKNPINKLNFKTVLGRFLKKDPAIYNLLSTKFKDIEYKCLETLVSAYDDIKTNNKTKEQLPYNAIDEIKEYLNEKSPTKTNKFLLKCTDLASKFLNGKKIYTAQKDFNINAQKIYLDLKIKSLEHKVNNYRTDKANQIVNKTTYRTGLFSNTKNTVKPNIIKPIPTREKCLDDKQLDNNISL